MTSWCCLVVLSLCCQLSVAVPTLQRMRRDASLIEKLEDSGLVQTRTAREGVQDELEPTEKKRIEEGSEETSGVRVKKAPNVCIKVSPCGRTICGTLVSAQGPNLLDLDTQRSADLVTKPGPMDGFYPGPPPPPLPHQPPGQARTYDVSPLSIAYGQGSGGYNAISYPSYGHSIFVQPAVPAIPYPTVMHQPGGGGIKHPGSALGHQLDLNFNLQRYPPHQDFYALPAPYPYAEIKRPLYIEKPYIGEYVEVAKQPLICQPYKSKLYDEDHPLHHDSKALNSSAHSRSSEMTSLDEGNIKEHLKRVNDIKNEITTLNQFAQRIVDQQDQLARMQAAHLVGEVRAVPELTARYGMYPGMVGGMGGGLGGGIGAGSMSSSQSSASSQTGGSMYGQQMPFPYMRSQTHAGNYPASTEDMAFFMNMLSTLRKLSAIQEKQPGAKAEEELISDLYQNPSPVSPQQQTPLPADSRSKLKIKQRQVETDAAQ